MKAYSGICNLSSSVRVVESRYVSDKQIISSLWSMVHAFKKWIRTMMGGYVAKIPVADWEIFFAITLKPWINFNITTRYQ